MGVLRRRPISRASATTLALALGALGQYELAADHARRSRQLLFKGGIPTRGFIIPDLWEASFLLCTDRFDDALAAYATAQARAVRRGEVGLLVQTHVAAGFILLLAGRWDDAESELEAGLQVTGETGNHAHDVGYHAMLAKIAFGRGDRPGSASSLAAGRAALEHGRHLFGIDVLLWAEAEVLEADGDPSGALDVLATVWTQTAHLRGLMQYRNLGPDLARLAQSRGDADMAHSIADEMDMLRSRTDVTSVAAAARRTRGLADDDPDALLEAVHGYRRSARRIEMAAACEDTAHALLRSGRAPEATALLDEAASIHVECGATVHVARLDALLRSSGVRRRRSGRSAAAHGWDALSPTERNVVKLVRQGLSNPQIGAQLFISRRTVETHVSHIFRKIGVSSRTELASAATAHSANSVSSD